MGHYAPVPGKIPGIEINLAGNVFTMPPLNLDGCQQFEPLQARFMEMQGQAGTDLPALYRVVAECLHLSLARNYPEITVEDIVGLLDARSLRTSLEALAQVSGYVPAGETMPAAR